MPCVPATTTVPSDVKASVPTSRPSLPGHDRLGVALEIDRPDAVRRARAIAGGRRVERVSTAIVSDHRALAGKNSAGRWMSLPDCRPMHVQDAVARDRIDDAGRPAETAAAAADLFGRRAGNRRAGRGRRSRRRHRRRREPGAAPARRARSRARRRPGAAVPAPRRSPPPRLVLPGAPAPAAPARPASAAAPFERHALARLADHAAIRLRGAAAAGGRRGDRRRHERHDPRRAGGHAAGALRGRRGDRRVELALPHDVAGVVVDRVHGVRVPRRPTSARTA